jgi:uncharacterized damage-inducible protein DinB
MAARYAVAPPDHMRLGGDMNFDGMWLPQDQDPRMQEQPTLGEKACLVGYLEHYRQTLAMKCDGLDAQQLATKSVPPSNISLLGLVRHMARVEQSWFRRVIEERTDLPRLFQEEDAGFDFPDVDDDLVRESHELWQAEIAYAREVLDRTDLDTVVDVHGEPTEVRDIIVHMVEEYARHCGHADLVRECVDGRTGQ